MHIDGMKVENKEIVTDKNVRTAEWNINKSSHGGNRDLEDKPKLLLQGGVIRLRAGEREESIVSPEKGSISGLGIKKASIKSVLMQQRSW